MPSLQRSVLSVVMLIVSSPVSLASIDCNHMSMGEFPMAADVCTADGDDSHMIVCQDGEGYFRQWELDTNCEGNHAFENAVSDMGMEAVCDAGACHLALFETYDEDQGSCDYSSAPDLAVYIIDACLAVGDSQSMLITCTGTHDAVVSYFDDDAEHECSGSATMAVTANEFFGSDCGVIIACDVMAGDEAETSASSESSESSELTVSSDSSDSSESSQSGGSSGSGESEQANCNHAVFDQGAPPMIADFCHTHDGDSRMLQCRGGEGFVRTWLQSTNCDGNTWVEEALSTQEDVEVVCDAADPCQLVVFEVYDDGSHSSDSSESGESSQSSQSSESSYDDSSSNEITSEPTMEPTMEPTTEPTHDSTEEMRRLQESSYSDSSSSDSVSCDYNSTPFIHPWILETCVTVDENESMIFTCAGTHDAQVQHFLNDPNHECSGAAITTTVEELQVDYCAVMVACNVHAGEQYTPTPTTEHDGAHASNDTIFGTLLIAVALLFNA